MFTSALVRRRRYGATASLSATAHRKAAAAAADVALAYAPMRMGTAKCSSNTGRVPNRPGNAKSITDHSSTRWFWMGEPVSTKRWRVCSDLHAKVICASGLRTRCPSSSTAYSHVVRCRPAHGHVPSTSPRQLRRTCSYVASTTSASSSSGSSGSSRTVWTRRFDPHHTRSSRFHTCTSVGGHTTSHFFVFFSSFFFVASTCRFHA
mmetsp:Transcript_10401/g.63476  ORF Transcript_10401/g.63476 Transcript_10401/m.63476 type:complete len:206 (+) Transcript_10401:1489-2106(+)